MCAAPARSTKSQALVGTTVANSYVLDKILGTGAHGSLFDARHARLGSRCALRLATVDAARRNSLLTALNQYAAMVHPHLSPPRDVFVLPDDQIAIASCLLPGQDLNQRVAEKGKLTAAEGALLFRQVVAGLHALHQKGLSHGNLTPSNVFFVRYDDVAIDNPLGDGKSSSIVQLIDMGLPLIEGQPATPADDQRALGRMMQSFVLDLSIAQRQVFEKAQDPKPEARYASILEMWQAFESTQGGKGKRAQAGATKTTVVPQVKLPPGATARSRRLILGGAAGLGIAVVLGVVLLRGSTPKPPPAVTAPVEKPAEVALSFEVTPKNAKVKLAGKTVDTSSTVRWARGEQSIPVSAEAAGFDTYTGELIPDSDRTVKIALTAAAAPPPEATTEKKGKGPKKKGKKGAK